MLSEEEIRKAVDAVKLARNQVKNLGYNTDILSCMYDYDLNAVEIRTLVFVNNEPYQQAKVLTFYELNKVRYPVDVARQCMIDMIKHAEEYASGNRMDPETAIRVLKGLQDWLYLSSMANGTSAIAREAIDIGIAAIEDKLGR